MIEILFTEGAAGSMQLAKGLTSITGEAFDIILETEDGHEPTGEELAQVRAQMEEEHRKKLENAIPVEGTPRDVACFPLNLSMGDISEPFSDARAEYLQSTVLISGPDFTEIGRELMQTARESRERVISSAEPLRIWYSRNPDELCGFCHLLTLLPKDAQISLVELPEHTGWGDVDPYELGRFLRLERPLTEPERRCFADQWRELQKENGPLRAVVNGRLVTVDADFYDSLLLGELEQEPERFHQGRLIGRILGKYALGISDSLLALRMEELISRGILIPVTSPGEGCPVYHRYLKKGIRGIPVDPDDWRLLSVDDSLKYKEINPTDGEELGLHAPHLTHCAFCWTPVEHTRHQHWFIPTDLSCCICEKCYHDFREYFHWWELDGWDIEWNGKG